MPGVGVLGEDYKTNRKQNGYTRMLQFANILISKPYTVRLYCDSGYSDKRMTRLVSALRGEARLMQGILKINLLADFRTSLLVGRL
jgi:hypothetical protein